MKMPHQNRESRNLSPSANAWVSDRTGLYVALVAMAAAFLSLGIAITEPKITQSKFDSFQVRLDQTADSATRSENHWRNIESENRIYKEQVKTLTIQLEEKKRADRSK